MNEELQNNRVEMEFSQWKAREERLCRLLGINPADNKSLLAEKLRQFEQIRSRYKSSGNLEEQHTLRILDSEIAILNKMLYPRLLVRILRKPVVEIKNHIRNQKNLRKERENFHSLHQQVQRIGFPDLSKIIKAELEKGQKNFSIPIAYYINEKEKISHTLSFSRDTSGGYQFEGYESCLRYEDAMKTESRHYFKIENEQRFSLEQSYNLLSGRSVERNGTWFQLDFNDRNALGNYPLKEFRAGYGYELEKILKSLPLKEPYSTAELQRLKESLAQGCREPVVLIKNSRENKFFIEANPQFKSINLYDQHQQKAAVASIRNDAESDSVQIHNIKAQSPKQSMGKSLKL